LGGAVSVWNASGSAYIDQSVIIGAVIFLLGAPVDPTLEGSLIELIDLDALMVNDAVIDLNAIEAIGESVVPEPGAGLLLTIALVFAGVFSLKR